MEEEKSLDESTIPEENAERQEIIPFQEDDLAAAMTSSGNIYVTLSGVCKAIGLSPRPQLRRILSTPSLAKGLCRIPLKTAGGIQRINCLRIDKVALWLAGVETNKVKPTFRGKIEAYQEDLAPIATQVFMRTIGIQATPTALSLEATSIYDQFQTFIDIALDIQTHIHTIANIPEEINTIHWQLDQAITLLESLAGDKEETQKAIQKLQQKTAGLTPGQAREVQEQISHIVTATEGKPYELKYGTIYGRIRHRFRTNTYQAIPENRFEELIQFLQDMLQNASSGQDPTQRSLF